MAHTKLYETLELTPNASENDIKKAYRKMAMKHHPDKGGDSAKFKEISAAFEILGNKEKRENYDRFGITDDSPQSNGPSGMNMDPMDIFNQMFGGSPFGSDLFGERFSRRPRKKVQQINFNISLEDLYKGKDVKMKIERNVMCKDCNGHGSNEPPVSCNQCRGTGVFTKIMQIGPGIIQKMQGVCPGCNGKGKVFKGSCNSCKGKGVYHENTFVNVTVNPGADNDERITMQDKGDFDIETMQYSDLQIILKQREHGLIKRKDKDLYIHYNVSLYDTLFGINIGYKHLDDKNYIFKLPPGHVLQYKSTYIARNMGMKNNGHMYLTFDIVFPKHVKSYENDKSFSINDMKSMFGSSQTSQAYGTHVIIHETHTKENKKDDSNIPECVHQ